MAKATKLRAAKSWVMLGFLILFSFAVILLGREQENLFTGHVAVQPIANMKAGSQESFEIKSIPGVFTVTVALITDTKNNLLTVKEDETISFDGKDYSKFTVDWKDFTAIERMEFALKVLEQELQRKGINPAELRLYVNGKELLTTQRKKEGRYIYYTATSTEAGEYVIGKANRPPTVQPTTALPISEREEEVLAAEAEEQPIRESTASSPVAEKVVQQPKISSGGRFWNWLRQVMGKE